MSLLTWPIMKKVVILAVNLFIVGPFCHLPELQMTKHSYPAASSIITLFVAALIILAGCSDPKSYEVSKLTDEQRKELGQKLTADEGQKLTAWMLRNAIAGKEPPVGTTVAMALKQQDEWIAKQKEEEAKAEEFRQRVEAERKAKQEEFAKLLSVALVSKKNSMGEYGQRWVGLDMAYENKSDKDIQGVKGVLKLMDIFGDTIMNVRWSYDAGVPAKKSTVERKSGVDINQFNDAAMKLWNTDFDKIKSTFEVSTIIFKDGTRMDAPE